MNRNLELILFRVYADLKAEAARGYLGMLSWIFEPLLYFLVFYFFFAFIRAQAGGQIVPFLLIGLVVWKWFSGAVPFGAKSISSSVNLMQQVYLPKFIFPCVAVVTSFIKFIIIFVLLLFYLIASGISPTIQWLTLPLLIIVQFMLTLGITGILAAIIPFLPDLNQFISNILMILFFLSGVIFDIHTIPAALQPYLFLNPLATLIADYRIVLIDGKSPGWLGLAGILALAYFLWGLARAIMTKYDRVYPKLYVR